MQSLALRRQRGFGLIDAVISISIFALVSLGYVQIQSDMVRQQEDKIAAQHALMLQFGANAFMNDNRVALLNSPTPVIAGFANPMAPTVAELAASTSPQYLPTGYTAANNLGMTMAIRLARVPTGCTPAVNCTDIAGLVYSTAPFLDNESNLADNRRVGAMATQVGDDGAFSPQSAPSTFLGASGTWAGVPNPVNQAGVLAVRAGFGSIGYANLNYLVRRDGTLAMTGSLNGGGNDLVNFGVVNANTAVDVKDAAACVRGQIDNTGAFYSRAAGCVLAAAVTNAGLQIWNAGGLNTVSMNSSALAMSDTPGVGIPKVTIDTTGVVATTDGNFNRAMLRGVSGRVETFTAGGAPAVTIDGGAIGGGRLSTNGLTINSYPAGWTGGLHGTDVLADGKVGVWDGTTVKGSMNVAGDSYVANNAEVNNVLQLNNVSTENTACPLAGMQSRNAAGALLSCVNNGTLLWLKSGLAQGVLGAPCAPDGSLAQDVSQNTLICRGGFYASFKDFVPSVVDLDSLPVTHGQNVTKPSCGTGGTPSLFIANGTSQTDPTGILNVYSLDLGSYWQVQITSGGGTSAGPGPQMAARIACIYP